MKFSIILFLTTVISIVHSDEVTKEDDFETIAPSEFITDDDWDQTYGDDLLKNVNMMRLDEVIGSPTYHAGDLLMDDKRMLQENNVTAAGLIRIGITVCSPNCEDTQGNVESDPTIADAIQESIESSTTASVTSFGLSQSECGSSCANGRFLVERFLQEPDVSTTLTFTAVLDEEVDTEGLLIAITESSTFIAATDAIEEATDGTLSDVGVSFLAAITDPPTKEPTNAPTKEPTNAPTKEPTNAPTKEPTNAPTQRSVRQPKSAKSPKAKKSKKTKAPTVESDSQSKSEKESKSEKRHLFLR